MERSDWMESSLTALPPGEMVVVFISDDQRKAGSTSRMWAESQPGPSRCQPSRQGYCGYCRVLYNNLDQHLSSLRHLDSVGASSRGSSTLSSARSSRAKLTLLERFLQDVLQHHPHRYNDPRPSHADLPSVSAPPLPRAELDELRFSDEDNQSLGTREHLPSSDNASCQPANQQEGDSTRSQSGEGVTEGPIRDRLSASIRGREDIGPAPTGHTHSPQPQAPPPQSKAPPSVHRKAHRKTNRRKTSESSSSSSPPRGPGQGTGRGPGPGPKDLKPWLSWQKERRDAHKEEAFSSDHSDPVEQTIMEVIQMCCYGVNSTPCQQEEAESFHFSLPVSTETQSDDWDSPVQVVLQRAQALRDQKPAPTPFQVNLAEGRDLGQLMDVQVDLEDQVYSYQLDSTLLRRKAVGGARQEQGFWTLPIEQVLPAPAYIPESFRGKTWAQIEQEDEEKVDKLVRQFRRGRFLCYFDSESLARYGRRSQNKKGLGENKEAEPNTSVLPLLDRDDEDSLYERRRRRRRRKTRGFRVASRCQVVKVSHSTQTVQLVVPAVRQPAPETLPTSVPAPNQDAAERTPELQTWRCLPLSYSNIITPVQPRTSLVYLLCSSSGPAPACTPASGSVPKRCRKKRRPLDLQGLKVKYKRLPVRFYDPGTNRILKNPPKGFLWRRSPGPSGPPPPCVRQLFRSLSPDLNTDRAPGEGAAGSSRVKGQTSADTPFSQNNKFLLSTLSRDSAQADTQDAARRRGRTSKTPPPPPHSRSERGRRVRKERTCPPPSKRRTRAQAMPLQPRREGLRRTGPSRNVTGSRGPAVLTPTPHHSPSPRRGRARRGRTCERGRR
ncbi:DBF4-type zinc finger-containing protein 2 isoform X2 [Xiphias gladius]|uniref:DBF4-type zinc finger-containing protein 2 isoform X2 n=1 Tax=Xiphias gladius TaxID=8245 RepID=UPI001A97EBE1|nr:DBF4-type zinc finger-containing protein 2 isoform X2 [Xiphias gladius]XP_039979028.1 DBF4-type zinc finger-containing protein 2 isoform X2 [Xiphias gladius]